MKAILKKALTFVAVMFVSINASATVLTFDDVSFTGSYDRLNTAAGSGYGGLDWSDLWYVMDTSAYGTPSGYLNGMVSEDNVLFNGWGKDVSVSSTGIFDFSGAYFTGAWSNDLSIQIIGYVDGIEAYNQTMMADTSGPKWFDAGFLGIDSLTISSNGGPVCGTNFAMDNFTFNNSRNVPEPSILILLGIGLIGLGAHRCKA